MGINAVMRYFQNLKFFLSTWEYIQICYHVTFPETSAWFNISKKMTEWFPGGIRRAALAFTILLQDKKKVVHLEDGMTRFYTCGPCRTTKEVYDMFMRPIYTRIQTVPVGRLERFFLLVDKMMLPSNLQKLRHVDPIVEQQQQSYYPVGTQVHPEGMFVPGRSGYEPIEMARVLKFNHLSIQFFRIFLKHMQNDPLLHDIPMAFDFDNRNVYFIDRGVVTQQSHVNFQIREADLRVINIGLVYRLICPVCVWSLDSDTMPISLAWGKWFLHGLWWMTRYDDVVQFTGVGVGGGAAPPTPLTPASSSASRNRLIYHECSDGLSHPNQTYHDMTESENVESSHTHDSLWSRMMTSVRDSLFQWTSYQDTFDDDSDEYDNESDRQYSPRKQAPPVQLRLPKHSIRPHYYRPPFLLNVKKLQLEFEKLNYSIEAYILGCILSNCDFIRRSDLFKFVSLDNMFVAIRRVIDVQHKNPIKQMCDFVWLVEECWMEQLSLDDTVSHKSLDALRSMASGRNKQNIPSQQTCMNMFEPVKTVYTYWRTLAEWTHASDDILLHPPHDIRPSSWRINHPLLMDELKQSVFAMPYIREICIQVAG